MYPTCNLSVETGLAASLSPRLQPRLGKKMFVSVGSLSNNDDTDNKPAERDRADILEFNRDGSGHRVYAWGIRNAVGIALDRLSPRVLPPSGRFRRQSRARLHQPHGGPGILQLALVLHGRTSGSWLGR
jgi:hypothetical protein